MIRGINMLVTLPKWKVTIKWAGRPPLKFSINDQFMQNVLRKIADMEFTPPPMSIQVDGFPIISNTQNTYVEQQRCPICGIFHTCPNTK